MVKHLHSVLTLVLGFFTVAGACADAATEKNPNTSVRTECKCLTIKFYIM